MIDHDVQGDNNNPEDGWNGGQHAELKDLPVVYAFGIFVKMGILRRQRLEPRAVVAERCGSVGWRVHCLGRNFNHRDVEDLVTARARGVLSG